MPRDEEKTALLLPPVMESERWIAAAEETSRLLSHSAELARKRKLLADQRLALFRDMVAEARRFVDDAMRRR
jgi:hypothetical protein